LSFTVTVCVAVALRPFTSVTVQVTVVTPTGKVEGESLVTVATEQLSDVTGVPSTTLVAEHDPGLVLVVTLAGGVIVGS
jgi:hypothetical protein